MSPRFLKGWKSGSGVLRKIDISALLLPDDKTELSHIYSDQKLKKIQPKLS